jgi:threonine dehydrogenase-like Zn-dependent dehydrogenase
MADVLAGERYQSLPTRMRAAVLVGPGRMEIHDVPVPSPKPGEVLIALEGCGLCGSNVPVWQGRPWFEYPFASGAPGHEGWGRVARVGEGVGDLAIGQRVAALSYHAFADYDVAPARQVVALPDELATDDVPGEPLGCAMNILRRSDIRAGQTVVIVGVGFLGALLTQLAARRGARVLALSRRPFACRVAETMGAVASMSLQDDDAACEWVNGYTGGRGAERVIEAVGNQRALSLATRLVGERGRLVIVGFHQDGPREVDMQTWNWRGIDVINAHERDPEVYASGMRAAVDAMTSGGLDPRPLYTHRFRLEEIGRAFDSLDQRPDGFLKGQVIP